MEILKGGIMWRFARGEALFGDSQGGHYMEIFKGEALYGDS